MAFESSKSEVIFPSGSGGGGSGTHTSGLYVDIPASPKAGDSYEVIATDPTCPGALFYCGIDGSWVYVGSAVLSDDFTSGWTAYNGAGSATISTGAIALTSAAGTKYRITGFGYAGPCAYRAIPSCQDFSLAIRLASVDATNVTAAELEIATDVSGDTGTRVCVQANRLSGDVNLFSNSANAILATAPGRFAVFTGQEWLLIVVRGTTVTAYSGIGVAGAVPTAWTVVGSAVIAATWASCAFGLMSAPTAVPTAATAAVLVAQFQPPTFT